MAGDFPYNEEPIKVPRFEEAAGFYTTKQRSNTMSKIRAKNTKPELMLRKALWAQNIRFRIHNKNLPGKPDIAIKKYKLAIFVDGEFWHGKDWENKKHTIKSNQAFWIPKIERNMQRDKINREKLQSEGYVVFRFWGSEIKKELPKCINQITLYLETAKEVQLNKEPHYFNMLK